MLVDGRFTIRAELVEVVKRYCVAPSLRHRIRICKSEEKGVRVNSLWGEGMVYVGNVSHVGSICCGCDAYNPANAGRKRDKR